MKCQRCGYTDAMVHIQDFPTQGKRGIWLCPRCSAVIHGQPSDTDETVDADRVARYGDPVGAGSSVQRSELEPFMGHVFGSDEPLSSSMAQICSTCRHSLKDFRNKGILGCVECYEAFKVEIMAALEQTQPHVYHLGQVPSGDLEAQDGRSQLARVRIALEQAVSAEEYEKAATLRDQLHDLEQLFEEPGQGTS